MALLWILLFLVLFGFLAYHRASLVVWTIASGTFLFIVSMLSAMSFLSLFTLWGVFASIAVVLNIKPLRRQLFSKYIYKNFRKNLPHLSETEKEALAAGTVGWDGDLFTGMPNWQKLLSFNPPVLTVEEQLFLDGPVKTLCEMIDNWDITHNRFAIPDHIWDFLKQHGFFGIIIPKAYGGKEFSAYAHSEIITKISGKSMSVSSVVAVPNSLGPAELLLHYGTEEQKNYYLPRLATGLEIPSFALTGPEAGSDASAMPDHGIVCYDIFEGEKVLGIRLNWNKRYITLAPVATVLGLAFKLYDPDHLIGGKEALGITCALIPTNLPGITIGRRHFPLYSAFPNGPTQGKDVFIPMDWVIGGQKMVGQGWRMLVECLAAGRAISLPSMAVGGAKVSTYAGGAYAQIRRQFHSPIGKFGGVAEVLARMAGRVYLMDATRLFTIAAIDRGEKPAVPAAISKYHVTEMGRKVINDAMDIHGGKGICMGPRNYLAINYQETPISITVEGANILTRSMIIFGQGAIRCHPYILKELVAANLEDQKIALKQFDYAIFGHMGFLLSNIIRTFILGITGGRLTRAPAKNVQRYYQHLTRFSSAFAFTADCALIILGGSLKRREKLSSRLADVLSMLYIGSAVLKQFHDHGDSEEELSVVQWACQSILYQAQKQLYGVLTNFPRRWLGLMLRWWVFPLGKTLTEPRDNLEQDVAKLMLQPNSLRSQLAKGAHLVMDPDNPVGFIEYVLRKVLDVEDIEQRIEKAWHDKRIKGYTLDERIDHAVKEQIITEEESLKLQEAVRLRREIIAVDDFAEDEIVRFPSEEKLQPRKEFPYQEAVIMGNREG